MADSEAAATTEQTLEETTATAESKQDKSKEDVHVTSPAKKKPDKVDILLKATADAPIMKKKKWSVERTKKISSIAEFIRKYIKCEPAESLFLYVNQAFSPSPDQEIGNLFECYGSDGKLVLHYCTSEAWG